MARRDEIMKGFEEAYRAALADTDPDDVVLAREIRLRSGLETYMEWRDEQLAEIAAGLASVDESLTEDTGAARWKDRVSEVGSKGFKMVADLDDNEESILNVFVLGVATQEGDFWARISSMPYGAVHGFLGESAAIMRKEHEELAGKWGATEDGMETINARSERVGQQMREAFDQALQKSAEANRRAAERLKSAFTLFKGYDDASSGGEPGMPDVVVTVLGPLELLVDSVESVKREYEALYRAKETRLVVYGNHREAVRAFLDTTNLEVARAREWEDRKAASSIARSMITAGQREDAGAFVNTAAEQLSKQLANYEHVFNAFVTRFKGIFIGPIGTEVLDELLHGRYWQETEEGIRRLNLETELKKYYDEAEDMWSIPVDGLDDELRDAFTDQFRKQLRTYDDAVESATKAYLDALRMMGRLSIDGLVDTVRRFKGWRE